MNLSIRAVNYLSNRRRNENYIISRLSLESYFIRNSIPVFEKVIDYCLNFSGYVFAEFKTGLITATEISRNEPIEYELKGEHYYFYCGTHAKAQCYFFINESGAFFTDGYDDSFVAISSSFEIEIEKYALYNEIKNWIEYPYYYEMINTEMFKSFVLLNNFAVINECTDSYNEWYCNGNVIIQKGIFFVSGGCYLHLFGIQADSIAEVHNGLKLEGIIKS